MKILITGAAGLYGVHLTDLLCRQRWVRQVIGVDDFSRKFFTKDPFIKSPSFDRKFKLLKMKYQGLTNLIESSSGERHSGKNISKRGRKLMRTTLYQMALASIKNNRAIKYEYQYRIKTKKQKKMKALTAVACKMLRVIYALVSANKEYDERKISRHYYESEIKREENICEWVTPIIPPSGSGYNSGDTVMKNTGHPLPMTLNEVMSGAPVQYRDDTGRNDRVRHRKSGGTNPLVNIEKSWAEENQEVVCK